MPLRMTDKKKTKRFESDGDWIELRVGGLTKGETDSLADLQTSMSLDTPDGVVRPGDSQRIEINRRIAEANQRLFAILCVDWSLPSDPSSQAYSDLDEDSGRWIDECIGDVLEERRRQAEGNPTEASFPAPSSEKPRRRAAVSKPTE